jgi:hypothetical protein
MSTNEERQPEPRPKTFLERLVIEENELSQKLDALKKALESDGLAEKVSDYQFELLGLQLSTMTAYRRILIMRIKDLESKH